MKKILIKILSCVLCLCLAGSVLAGCDSCDQAKWDATKMNQWGNVVSLGGFMAETENYYYYINGMGVNTDDNSYGKPVKGSLMVADKNDLSKTEIAVPKIFGAVDKDAGIYIFGDYVYYGTPSTDKGADGEVAKSELMFRRAKLDGSKDEHLFTVSTLATNYRVAEKNGVVYIVYYDTASTSLISYNTSAKEETVIAKTDEKTDVKTEGVGYESLASYKFLDNAMLDSAIVVYTTTVYSLPYNEDMNEGTDSTRPTEAFNRVYAYTLGGESKLVYDGSIDESTYAVVNNDKNYVYIQKTSEFGKVTAYAVTASELIGKTAEQTVGVEVVPEYALALGNLIVDLDNVYILPTTTDAEGNTTTVSENAKIYKDTMRVYDSSNNKIDHTETKELVAILKTLHSLLTVYKDNLYFYDINLIICRVNLTEGEDAKEICVSQSTATGLSTWYAPEIHTVNGKDYFFYCDSSEYGLSYVKYVDLNGEVVAEDTDGDEEDDLFYLEGYQFLGNVLDSDKAKLMQTKIDDLVDNLDDDGVFVFETDEDGKFITANDKLVLKDYAEVKAEYDALPEEVKEDVDASLFEDYDRAIEIASLMYKLDGVEKLGSVDKDTEEYKAMKAVYDGVKGEISKYYSEGEHTELGSLIPNNLKANYTKAVSLFEPKEEK